ncbi:MAG: hypothetical protein WEA76_08470, partial [Acidimicrobiia bacterium]
MSDTLARLADEYWDVWMESAPTLATIFGDHRFDDQLGPVTHDETEAAVARMRDLATRAERLEGLDAASELTRQILLVNARNNIGLVESGLFTAPISPFLGIQAGLASALSRSVATEPAHAEMLLERVRA